MALLEEIFYIINHLKAAEAEDYFIKQGFKLLNNAEDYRNYSKQIGDNKQETISIRLAGKEINYCQIFFPDKKFYDKALNDATIKYGFVVVEDKKDRVLYDLPIEIEFNNDLPEYLHTIVLINNDFTLKFSSHFSFNISLMKRPKRLEEVVSVELLPPI